MERIDVDKLSEIDKRIFEILGEHKTREEQLTEIIHSQSLEIEKLKRRFNFHINNVDSAHQI